MITSASNRLQVDTVAINKYGGDEGQSNQKSRYAAGVKAIDVK